ncbi:hypothetical protein ACQ4PT_030935 [Festuca glaucescens]
MDGGTGFPSGSDVLAHIFRRVQGNARRRLRLVCRHWRQVIDTRTATSLNSRAMTLVVTVERAYVFDDLSTERCSWEMTQWPGRFWDPTKVVGSCNGIICMCDTFGSILLHNPVNHEYLAVPSLPPRYRTGTPIWHQTYSFTHDQATGRYMVVHAPQSFGGQVMVFVLGEASWRDVAVPFPTHNFKDGFVTIDSTMYWAVEGKKGKKVIMSFELDGERAPSVVPLPSSTADDSWRLTEVLGRLAIVFRKEVWVMEQLRWSRWYSLRFWRPRNQPKWHDSQHLTRPHFALGSNRVLAWQWLPTGGGCALYQHAASNDTTKARRGTVDIGGSGQGTMVAKITTAYDTFQRFDYVQTMEQLRVYKCW